MDSFKSMYAPKLNSKGQNFHALRDMPMNKKEVERENKMKEANREWLKSLKETYLNP